MDEERERLLEEAWEDDEPDAPLATTATRRQEDPTSSSPTTAAPSSSRRTRNHNRSLTSSSSTPRSSRRPLRRRRKWRRNHLHCLWRWPLVHIPRCVLVLAAVCWTLFFITWGLPRLLNPTPPTPAERQRDQQWVASSPYWLDRQACRWLSLCGVHHLRWDAPVLSKRSGLDAMVEGVGDGAAGGGDLKRRRSTRRRTSNAVDDEPSWQRAASSSRWSGSDGIMPDDNEKATRPVPDYVLRYAPLVHLYSGENFWPSHIAEHVRHMRPFVDGLLLTASGGDGGGSNMSDSGTGTTPTPLKLEDLDGLNSVEGDVRLTSLDDVETRPEWLHSHSGIPSSHAEHDGEEGLATSLSPSRRRLLPLRWAASRRSRRPEPLSSSPRESGQQQHQRQQQKQQHKPNDVSGHSTAPAILVLVGKGDGIIDAFWFFFYSYNLGQTVLSVRFGNHVGDWEHCMVRFEHGVPKAMFLSEHAGGQAYVWQALEKMKVKMNGTAIAGEEEQKEEEDAKERPVIYSAVGSHAMYAMPGNHPYVLPFGMLKDVTDKGPLWDPARNAWAYWYDPRSNNDDDGEEGEEEFKPIGTVGVSGITTQPAPPPTGWTRFAGAWGDALYGLGDHRQWRLFGQYHYITGPQGPRFKNLGRETMCPGKKCRVLESLEDGKKGTWYSS